MRSVYIVGLDTAMVQMFLRQGWKVVDNISEDIDLIQFTGGEDVDPSYYGETRHPATRSNPSRDAYEASLYNKWVGKVAMAGICRGAQFLNVMNGGRMWQHVTDHAIGGTHEAFCRVTETPVAVTSTHHQMMIPSASGKVLMTATLAREKHTADKVVDGFLSSDTEAVFYPETHSLCFQPHPEYLNINHECQIAYFGYLDKFVV